MYPTTYRPHGPTPRVSFTQTTIGFFMPFFPRFDFKNFKKTIPLWGPLALLCGCSPLLSPAVQHHMSHVRIVPMDERMGQKLRNRLEVAMGCNAKIPLYNLDVVLMEQDLSLVLNKQGQSCVENHTLKAQYTLSRLRDGCILTKGMVRTYGVKPLTVSYYSQTVMDQATKDRALDSVVQQLMIAVAMAFQNQGICPCPMLAGEIHP
jgi:hypothetical protein